MTVAEGAPGGEVTVGLDIGTTSVKGVAVDAEGTVLARARVPHEVRTGADGTFEHDVDAAWRTGILDALGQVAHGRDVAAVQVAAMVPSLAAVRAEGCAASPGLLYGDRRGVDRRADGGVGGGAAGDQGELLGFLRWLAAEVPDAAGYWPAQAVANHALAGVAAIDELTAMAAIPLYGAGGWDAQLAAAAGATTGQLPRVVGPTDAVGRVADGLPAAGALVGGGTIDALGEQLVAGADEAGDVLVILGATLITWAVTDEWVEADGVWTIPHTTPGRVLVGGPSTAGGMFVDRLRRWTREVDEGELDAVDPGDLPVWLPYVRGERCPLHRRDLRAELHDAGLHHDAVHVARAGFEASAFVVRHLLDRARGAGVAPRRIVATGGGVRARHWVQAIADVTRLPVHVVAVPEGAALGAAFSARCVAGLEGEGATLDRARRWARTSRIVEPDPAWSDAAEVRYRRFLELTERLR